MKTSMALSLLMIVAVACGCVSQPSAGFRPGEENRLSIVQAVESLLTDPMFTENYAVALDAARVCGKARPVVTIMPIENNVDNRGDAVTQQMYRRLQTAVRKTGKFDIIDPAKRKGMSDVVIKGPDLGESGDSVQNFGNYSSADFVMHAELVKEETGAISLNLDMEDVRSGTVFWSEVVTPSDSLVR